MADECRLPRNLMFDLDGTLLDSLPGIRHSAMAAFAACGLKANAAVELRALIGPPIREILAKMAERPASEAELDALVQAFRVSYDSEGWKITPHYDAAAETLREMKASGRRLFVVSNKPRHISDRILEAEGTLDFFDEVVTRDSRKPAYAGKREMMRYLLEKWQFSAGDCLMIGDTMEDAESASEVGMSFCLMAHGYGNVPESSAVPVAFRFDHFSELVRFDRTGAKH